MDKELILNEDIFKQLIKQFKIWPEKKKILSQGLMYNY